MVKKDKSTLVKIDTALYNVVKELVEQNHVEFPSMKYFIDKAIMNALGFRQYNIEGIDHKNLKDRPLKRVVGESTKSFFICNVCDRAFLKDKNDNTEASKICQNCKQTILHFADKLKEDKNK